jgi:cytochrome oxidase Cu insertion factor (SCO1/SenC/PrrC family)
MIMNEVTNTENKRSPKTPTLIAGTFILFFLAAFIFYKFGLHPSSTKNYGTLVSPARPLPEFTLKTSENEEFTLDDMRHKWSYVYVIDNECDEVCKLNLIKMRNARLAQGTESNRVKYYLLLTKNPEQPLLDQLATEHQKLTILYGDESTLEKLLNSFESPEGKTLTEAQRVHMIDPIGNYMMFYEPGAEAIGFMEDLKFLLKVSQIG